MDIGDEVTLVPTEGSYQSPQRGVVLQITTKRVIIQMANSVRKLTFARDTGEQAKNAEFPRYRLHS